MKRLKWSDVHSGLLSVQEVDTIFNQLPEMCSEHERFLAALAARLADWDHNATKVGDLFLEYVSQRKTKTKDKGSHLTKT